MIIAKRLKGKAIATWLGPTGDAARRALSRARQRITNAPRRLDFYSEIFAAIRAPSSPRSDSMVARACCVYTVAAQPGFTSDSGMVSTSPGSSRGSCTIASAATESVSVRESAFPQSGHSQTAHA